MSKQQLQQVQQPTHFTGGDDLLMFQSSKELPTVEELFTQQDVNCQEYQTNSQDPQQIVELRKGLSDIQQVWIEKNQKLDIIIELIRKSSKNIYNYFIQIENETDSFSKNVIKNSKGFSGQLNQQQGYDLHKLANQFIGAFSILAATNQEMSQTNMIIIQNGLRDFSDQIVLQKKYINERQLNGIKNINNINERYSKQFQRYIKTNKELDVLELDQFKSQQDVKLIYNVAHSEKQNQKINEKQVEAEKEEQKVQQIVQEGNVLINAFPSQIQHNYNNIKDLFSQTLKRIIDSSISINSQLLILLPSFDNYVIDKKLQSDSIICDDDQKIVQDRIQKKRIIYFQNIFFSTCFYSIFKFFNKSNIYSFTLFSNSKDPDSTPPGINFIPIQQALQNKEIVSESQIKAFPEAAFQFVDVFEQVLLERRTLMKNISTYMNDLSDCFGVHQNNIETSIREIKNTLTSSKDGPIADLVYSILMQLLDQQQKLLEKYKLVSQLLKASVKIISQCITDQQSETSGFLNMIKRLFSNYSKTQDKTKWVQETSSFLGISLDSLREHEQQRIFQVQDQMIKVISQVNSSLYSISQSSSEQQTELEQRKEALDQEIKQVLVSQNQDFESVIFNNNGAKFDYDKYSAFSDSQQNYIDEKQFASNNQDQPTPINSPQVPHRSRNLTSTLAVPGENTPLRSKRNPSIFKNSDGKLEGSGKKEIAKFTQLFGVGEDEKPISSFNCAFSHKMLLQGKMYLFRDMVGFHSYFNSKSFVGNTTLSIPYTDIERIEKRKNALIFDNSIALITEKGELFFTSYVKRDKCYKIMSYLMETAKKEPDQQQLPTLMATKQKSIVIDGVEIPEDDISCDVSPRFEQPQSLPSTNATNLKKNKFRKSNSNQFSSMVFFQTGMAKENPSHGNENQIGSLDISSCSDDSDQSDDEEKDSKISNSGSSQQNSSPKVNFADPVAEEDFSWIHERRNKQKQETMFQNQEKMQEFQILFDNVTPREIFHVLFNLKPYKPQPQKPQDFPNFRHYYMQEFQKDTDIVFDKFYPSPPEWYSNLECYDRTTVKLSEQTSKLVYNLVHPVREKIPFGPKVSHCENKEKYYWISPEEFIVEREMSLSKIPYCDYFTVRFQYIVTQQNPDQTKLQVKLYVNFMKSTTFKGKIQSSTLNENTESINDIFTPQAQKAIQNYLQFEKPQLTQKENEYFQQIELQKQLQLQKEQEKLEMLRQKRLQKKQQQKQQKLNQRRQEQQEKQNSAKKEQQLLDQQEKEKQMQYEQEQIRQRQIQEEIEKKNQQYLLQKQLNAQLIEERRNRYKAQSFFQKIEKSQNFELIVPDVHPREIFNVIFYYTPFKQGSQQYPHFQYYFMQEFQKDTDIIFGKYSPSPPEWYANLDCLEPDQVLSCEDSSLHDYKYIHPVREKIPFGPKVSSCENKEKYYWISADEFVMEKEVFLSKIPYCDYFTVRSSYHFTKNDQNGTNVICKIYVNFTKSTTFKGKIESSSLSENTDVWKNQFAPQMLQVMANYVKEQSEQRKQRSELLQKYNQLIFDSPRKQSVKDGIDLSSFASTSSRQRYFNIIFIFILNNIIYQYLIK